MVPQKMLSIFIDVSHLTDRQRNVVQEIASLYRTQNKAYEELMDSDSIHADMIATGLINEFDVDEHNKDKRK